MNSKTQVSRRSILKGAAVGSGALMLSRSGVMSADSLTAGPSSSVDSYVVPSAPGVQCKAIITTGDAALNGYRMVGIPDGLGAFRTQNTLSVFMHHELPAALGIARAHGSTGAFVSKWTINRKTLEVAHGEDLVSSATDIMSWDAASSTYVSGTRSWDRLCSADMPVEKALRHGNLGTPERLFLGGEEVTFGRAWARITTGPNAGQAWELPRLGKMAFENVVACPHGKEKTIVAVFDDGSVDISAPAASNPSEVYIYVGTKQDDGNEIERAGLTNGKLYGVRVRRTDGQLVAGETNQYGLGDASTGFIGKGFFELVEIGHEGDVSGMTGLEIEQDSINKNVFRMMRPEDGAWDPRGAARDLYFVTTASISLHSRLWRLSFADITRPELGGKIGIMLTNTELPQTEGWRMFDNITIDQAGRLFLQEDTGNNPWVSRIWMFDLKTHALTEVARHNPELFEPGVNPSLFITQDEESSGIIDAAHLFGPGWFLLNVQNHKASTDPELVEGGQLVAMFVPLE